MKIKIIGTDANALNGQKVRKGMKNESIATSYCINIPEDATNGDVIKAMFPNTNIEYWAEYSTYNVEFPNDNDVKHFSYDWWNAPFKTEREE